MTNLYKYIANTTEDEPTQFEPLHDAAIDETWKYAIPLSLGGLGIKTALPFLPYMADIWAGRNLLFHKPFDKMTKEEYTNYGYTGRDFYKKVLNPQKAQNKFIEGEINLPNSKAMKPDYRYMEQYPLLRKNINEASENTFLKPHPKIDKNGNAYIRSDAQGFNNLKVNWKGEDYIYQIKKNAYDNQNYFHNIKPYKNLYDYIIEE